MTWIGGGFSDSGFTTGGFNTGILVVDDGLPSGGTAGFSDEYKLKQGQERLINLIKNDEADILEIVTALINSGMLDE